MFKIIHLFSKILSSDSQNQLVARKQKEAELKIDRRYSTINK